MTERGATSSRRGSGLNRLSAGGRVSMQMQMEEARKVHEKLNALRNIGETSFSDDGSQTTAETSPPKEPELKAPEETYYVYSDDEAEAAQQAGSSGSDDDDGDEDGDGLNPAGEDARAQKERAYAQAVEVMNAELQFWRKQVHDLYLGCAADLDPGNTSFRYALVPFVRKPMAMEDEDEPAPAASKAKRPGPGGGGQGGGGGVAPEEGGGGGLGATGLLSAGTARLDRTAGGGGAPSRIMEPHKLTFKGHAPATEAGRVLEQRFEDQQLEAQETQAARRPGAGGPAAAARANLKATRRADRRQKENRSRKDRIQVERRLNANLDKHVARSVNELVYRAPTRPPPPPPATAALAAAQAQLQAKLLDGRSAASLVRGTPTAGSAAAAAAGDLSHRQRASLASGGGGGFSSRASLAAQQKEKAAEQDARRNAFAIGGVKDEDGNEDWPIALSDLEMDPRLFLTYACERVALPSGARVFRHFVLSAQSRRLFVFLYWFVHCRFFQEGSERDQEHLLAKVAGIYVAILQIKALDQSKDFFFKYYPYVTANAIYWAFYYLCPGSRHLYTGAFRKILYKEVAQLLTGVDVCPVSVQVLRRRLYPEEAPEDEGAEDVDALPPLRHKAGAALPPGGGSAAAAAAAAGGPEMDNGADLDGFGWPASNMGTTGADREVKMPKVLGLHSQSAPVLPHQGRGGIFAEETDFAQNRALKQNPASGRDLSRTGGNLNSTLGSALSFSGRLRSTMSQNNKAVSFDLSASRSAALALGRSGEIRQKLTAERIENKGRLSQQEATSATSVPMSSTSIPDEKPIYKYAGSRDTLRFKQQRPAGLKRLKPRQEREGFDAAAVSPMLQEFLQTTKTAGRRPEPMVRTVPVQWCATGATDTHRRVKTNKEYHDSLLGQHLARVNEFKSTNRSKRRTLKSELASLDQAKEKTFERGQVGKKAMDIVNLIEEKKKKVKQRSTVQSAMIQQQQQHQGTT